MRVGLRYVRGLSGTLLDCIDDERAERPFSDLEDFTRRTHAPTDALENLATAGAFGCFSHSRRSALWAAGALRDARSDKLPGMVTGLEAPALPGMHEIEEVASDLRSTGVSAARHPTEFVREKLAGRGVVTADALRDLTDRSIVDVAGVVTHRQQPSTARGVVFLNLEDETGLINVICTPDVWKRFRRVARTAPALEVRGVLERYQGVINVLARRIVALPLRLDDLLTSRDFR
jgi:error-prone DNA polymerase